MREQLVTHIHSVSTGRDLAGVALSQSPVERVGKGIFPQVGEKLLVNLEGREVGGVGDSLLGEGLNDGRLVGSGIDELVVNDLNVRVVSGKLDNLIGDGLGIGKGRDILANTSKGESDILGVCSAQLGTGLLANEH